MSMPSDMLSFSASENVLPQNWSYFKLKQGKKHKKNIFNSYFLAFWRLVAQRNSTAIPLTDLAWIQH